MRAILQGLTVLTASAAVFGIALPGFGEAGARALAFVALVAGDLGIILTNRSGSRTLVGSLAVRNPVLWWVLGAASALLGLALASHVVRSIFRFGEVGAAPVAAAVLAGVLTAVPFELATFARRRRGSRRAPEP